MVIRRAASADAARPAACRAIRTSAGPMGAAPLSTPPAIRIPAQVLKGDRICVSETIAIAFARGVNKGCDFPGRSTSTSHGVPVHSFVRRE